MPGNNDLVVFISANIAKFDAGLKRAQGGLAKFSRGLASVVAGGAALAGVREIDQLATASIRAADEIGKAAKTAGIGARALQEYRYAAELAGNSQQQLDDAVGRFNRRLGEARNGNKAYAETFRQIGVVASDTNEQALDKTFRHLADIGDVTVRTSKATKVFGDDARRMALLVSEGADALERQRKQAHDLGVVLDGDLVKAAEKANDRLTIMEKQLSVELNTAVLSNIEGFTAWKKLLNDIAIITVQLAAGLGKVAGGVKALTDDELVGRIESAQRRIDQGKRTGRTENSGLPELEIERLRAEQRRRASVSLDDIQAGLGPKTAPVTAAFEFRGKTPKAPSLKSDALSKAAQKAQESIARIVQETATPLEKIRNDLAEIEKLQPFAESPEQAEALARAASRLHTEMEDLKTSTKDWGFSIKEAGRGLSDVLAGAVIYSENLGASLSRLIKQLAFKGLSNFLFNTAFSALGGGGGFLSLFGGPRAGGGPVFPGKSYLVGERGPELFSPSSAGSIIPNGAALGGGVVVNMGGLHFDVGLESVDQRIAQTTPRIAAAVSAAVEKARSRPSYA